MNSLDNLNNFSSNTLDGLNLINETISDTALLVDGSNTMLGDIDVNSHIIKNLGNGSSSNDAVNYSQLILKSDKTYVDSQLALKGDLTYIDTKDNLRLKLDGTTPMTGDLNLNTHKITNVSNGSSTGDAVNYGQLILKANTTYVDAQNNLQLYLTGGVMSGVLNMGNGATNNRIENLANGISASHAINKSQLDLKSDITYVDSQDALMLRKDGTVSMNSGVNLDINSGRLINVSNPINAQDASTKNYTDTKDALKMDKTGGTFTDAITINETTGTLATATKGTITLDHQDSGGGTSIVFKSKVNAGSDYGYIQYKDSTGGAGTELSQLTIGTENDASGSVEDNINFKNAGVERFKIGGSGVLSASSFSIPFRCITGRLNNNSTIGSPASQTFDFASFTTTADMILATFSSGVGYIYCNITTGSGSDAGDINIRLIEMTSGTDVILKNYYIYFGRNYDLTTSWETVMKNLNVPNNNTATTYSGHPPFILTKNRTFRFQISISRNTDDQYVVKWTDCYTCFFPVDSPNNI